MKTLVTIVISSLLIFVLCALYVEDQKLTSEKSEKKLLIAKQDLSKSLDRVICSSNELLNSLHSLENSSRKLYVSLKKLNAELSKIDTLKSH